MSHIPFGGSRLFKQARCHQPDGRVQLAAWRESVAQAGEPACVAECVNIALGDQSIWRVGSLP